MDQQRRLRIMDLLRVHQKSKHPTYRGLPGPKLRTSGVQPTRASSLTISPLTRAALDAAGVPCDDAALQPAVLLLLQFASPKQRTRGIALAPADALRAGQQLAELGRMLLAEDASQNSKTPAQPDGRITGAPDGASTPDGFSRGGPHQSDGEGTR